MRRLFLLTILFLFNLSCANERSISNTEAIGHNQNLKLKYAKQFEIQYADSEKTVTILQPWSGSKKKFTYYLSNKKATGNFIQTPVNAVVCLSPTPLAMLNLLGLTGKVVAVGSKTDMYNAAFYKKFKAVAKNESGSKTAQNFEKLIELAPDLIFESATGSVYDSFEKLEELNLKTALFSAHTEPHPLGRAEWIKYVAAFFNREKEAEIIFDSIVQRYLAVQKKVTAVHTKPKVFVGYPWKDAWIVPGGNSYMARFIKDAGGSYAYASDTTSGNLYVTVEKVLDLLPGCDIWLNPGVGVMSMADVEKIPVLTKKVTGNLKIYNNNYRLNEFGKNDFWESGILAPDVILNDLVKLFHPELLADYNPYYYRTIK